MSPLLTLLALMVAGSSATGPGGISYTAKSTLVTASDPSLPLYAAPAGVGYDGVAGLLITKPSGTFLCTGSLVGSAHQHVVTAAHCVTGATSIQAVFFPPSGGSIVRTTSTYTIHSGYTGNVIDQNDIAVIDLGNGGKVNNVQAYGFYTGNAVGQVYNQVGFGASGSGTTGAVLPAGLRRQGFNRFDFSGADPVFGGFFGDQNILFADFDDGLAAQDASCQLTAFFTASNAPYCDLGLGLSEALSAGGDSGGPLLIGGRLAAVTSFGLTFGSGLADVDDLLNSTFGEFAGYVPIGFHAGWLAQQVTPEPMTIILVATGLAGVGMAGLVRRRRARS